MPGVVIAMVEHRDESDYASVARPVSRAQASTSGQFQAGLPPTVHRGSGSTPRVRQMSTVGRLTPSRSAISGMPTGSQFFMGRTVKNLLTPGKRCSDTLYMTTAAAVTDTTPTWTTPHGVVMTRFGEHNRLAQGVFLLLVLMAGGRV